MQLACAATGYRSHEEVFKGMKDGGFRRRLRTDVCGYNLCSDVVGSIDSRVEWGMMLNAARDLRFTHQRCRFSS